MSTASAAAAVTPATPPASGTGLELRGISKQLGGRTIVHSLDLSVAPGELVCLLGPSGCGKTTTLRMVAGFLTPETGQVLVDGADVTHLPPERRPSAMVFQNYALWPHMSVFKNVAFPLKLAKVPRAEITQRVERVLEMVNLMHHRNSRPGQISGGEQQRVALARALVQEPKVLLLDEPLSNLDARLRVRVREDIREIQQRLGITTVMVTHDQDEAMAISDRVAVMNHGLIEQVSAPTDLYREPQTEFVASFVGSLNKFAGEFRGSGFVPGSDVTAVRPEDVLLSDAGSGDLQGTVRTVTPHGHFTEVTIALPGEQTVRSYVVGQPPEVGAQVGVRLQHVQRFRDGRRA